MKACSHVLETWVPNVCGGTTNHSQENKPVDTVLCFGSHASRSICYMYTIYNSSVYF